MTHRYRLTIASKAAGIFNFPEERKEFRLRDHTVQIVARNADTLSEASKLHFDGYEFADENAAREAGERLRLRLRILNAALGLGLNIPLDDSVTGSASTGVKQRIAEQHGAVLLDNVFGLCVHPNDDRHAEAVFSAKFEVRKGDGAYLIDGLQSLWPVEVTFDQASEDALSLLGGATLGGSERTAFLTTYLALETLIPRAARSDAARELLSTFQLMLRQANLEDREIASLEGSIERLRTESFSSAAMKFIERISPAPVVRGMPARSFISCCIRARNAIAHGGSTNEGMSLTDMTHGLRELVLSLIWTRSNIPTLKLNVPPDRISFVKPVSVRVL